MHLIDEDHITQAVIACHAGAEDARLRDVMTSLVQHLHAFAREVRLTEAEWRSGLRFLAAAGRATGPTVGPDVGPDVGTNAGGRPPGNDHDPEDPQQAHELALLSEVLGLTTLVTALNQHRPPGPGARPTVRATFTPSAAATAAGPVAELLRALGREA
ncbi:MAG: hypothetical protein HZC37_16940 [Burkholderiales bacterium]|nr:hypothetical protein [Burkholderiales bacterium]